MNQNRFTSMLLPFLPSYQTHRVGIRSPRESTQSTTWYTQDTPRSRIPTRRNGVRAFKPPRTLARPDAPPLRFLLFANAIPSSFQARLPPFGDFRSRGAGVMGLAPDSSSADFPIVERSTEVRSVPRTPEHLRGLVLPLPGPPSRLPGAPSRAGPSSNPCVPVPRAILECVFIPGTTLRLRLRGARAHATPSHPA